MRKFSSCRDEYGKYCMPINNELPRVYAEVRIPTSTPSIPTSTPSLPSSIPTSMNTPNADAVQNQAQELLGQQSSGVPTNLRDAFNQNQAAPVNSDATTVARESVQESLASAGAPQGNADEISRGNIQSIAGDASIDPSTLASISTGLNASFRDAYNQRVIANMQALWVLGVQNPADCSVSNDNGKDLCKAIEELQRIVDDTKNEADQALTKARRLRIYVSSKPAFLNTPSTSAPVCTGLLAVLPTLPLNLPSIVHNAARYQSGDNLVSAEAIRQQLDAPSGSSSGSSGSSNSSMYPVDITMQASAQSAQAYRDSMMQKEQVYDQIYARSVGNFDRSLKSRLDIFKTHADELKTITDALKQVTDGLRIRPRTP